MVNSEKGRPDKQGKKPTEISTKGKERSPHLPKGSVKSLLGCLQRAECVCPCRYTAVHSLTLGGRAFSTDSPCFPPFWPLMRELHPRRRNVTTSMVGLKIGHIRKNLTQSGEPQRYNWERRSRRRRGGGGGGGRRMRRMRRGRRLCFSTASVVFSPL